MAAAAAATLRSIAMNPEVQHFAGQAAISAAPHLAKAFKKQLKKGKTGRKILKPIKAITKNPFGKAALSIGKDMAKQGINQYTGINFDYGDDRPKPKKQQSVGNYKDKYGHAKSMGSIKASVKKMPKISKSNNEVPLRRW